MRTIREIDNEIRGLEERLAELRGERASVAQAPSHYLCANCGSETTLYGTPGKHHVCWRCGSYRLRKVDL